MRQRVDSGNFEMDKVRERGRKKKKKEEEEKEEEEEEKEKEDKEEVGRMAMRNKKTTKNRTGWQEVEKVGKIQQTINHKGPRR